VAIDWGRLLPPVAAVALVAFALFKGLRGRKSPSA
jgi:hypothetical protein